MSLSSTSEDLKEFEEQIRLQSEKQEVGNDSKTRVDPDGTVMEWDEQRKAWFPKIDDDFIARYQMNYGLSAADQTDAHASVNPSDWTVFNSQLAKLREEKGEQSEEVQNLTKSAHDALSAYYNSPAYREWYGNYCKQLQQTPSRSKEITPKSIPVVTNRHGLKPSERIRASMISDTESADDALARAEAEQLAGLPVGLCDSDDNLDNVQDNDEDDQTVASCSGTSTENNAPVGKRKTSIPQPAWYETKILIGFSSITEHHKRDRQRVTANQLQLVRSKCLCTLLFGGLVLNHFDRLEMADEKNTHVYVTGLPPEITENEFLELMCKCGVIMNEPFSQKPRIKLYTDEHGKPKGDGRCCYIKVESVDLALKIIDGMQYSPGHILHVERAKFQPKGQFDPKRRRRLTLKEKKKLKEQQENLFRWGIDTSKFVRSRKERVLILKNVFIETDFLNDVTLIPVVRDRIRSQCAKCGVVKKVVVHDAHPEGVVTVTFGTPEEADAALVFLDKALFNYPGSGSARQLDVERWDGKTNYSVKEDESEESCRIQQWNEFLGGDSSDDEVVKTGDVSDITTEVEGNKVPHDYWETDSPIDHADTDDAGGSSGDETA